MGLLLWFVKKVWNWFWYRHGKVRYRIWVDEDRYIVSARNGSRTVYNCYGSTLEIAKMEAFSMLVQEPIMEKSKRKWMTKGNGYELYRVK